MIVDIASYSIDGLRRRQLRSWLTIIGIVIGIMAIVLLVTLGQGLDRYVKEQLSFFSDDAISITPGAGSGASSFLAAKGSLTEKDWHAIQNIPGVDVAAPTLRGNIVPIQFKGNNAKLFVMAFTSDYTKIYKSTGIDLEKGRPFREGDRGVAVVGYTIANEFWGTSKKREIMQLGSRVIVNNKSFTVIGVMKKSGGGIMSVADAGIYVPYEDARDLLDQYKGNDQLTQLDVKVLDKTQMKAVEEDIKRTLDNLHKVKKPSERDYQIMTSETIKERVGTITTLLTVFLLIIAAISLAVGCIGVANTMFMSVLERTREIGVLKAVGADDRTIMTIFLLESGMIGAVGGVIAVVLSYGLVTFAVFVASLLGVGLPFIVETWVAAVAIVLAFSVGVLSGYFPARNAASLQAVEALRYE